MLRIKHLLLVLIIFLSGCLKPEVKNRSLGVIQSFTGAIYYHPAQSSERIRLQKQRPVFPLDKFVVGEDSYLHVYLHDYGDLYIEPDTTVILLKPDFTKRFGVMVKVLQGVVDCFIEKRDSRFGVQTPVAVAGVLGTHFKVEARNGQTIISLMSSLSGIEVQNLVQDMKSPPILRMGTDDLGQLTGQRITIAHSSSTQATGTHIHSFEDSSRFVPGIRSYDLKPLADPGALFFPAGHQNKKILFRSFREYHPTRTHVYQR